ncbi:MAG: hypothetical protein ABJD68_06085 [Nakamurella sp.]
MLERAGIREEFEALLSVEDAEVWKPAARSYQFAARACSVQPAGILLVAVHLGASSGRRGRACGPPESTGPESAYPGYFTAPSRVATSWPTLPAALA